MKKIVGFLLDAGAKLAFYFAGVVTGELAKNLKATGRELNKLSKKVLTAAAWVSGVILILSVVVIGALALIWAFAPGARPWILGVICFLVASVFSKTIAKILQFGIASLIAIIFVAYVVFPILGWEPLEIPGPSGWSLRSLQIVRTERVEVPREVVTEKLDPSALEAVKRAETAVTGANEAIVKANKAVESVATLVAKNEQATTGMADAAKVALNEANNLLARARAGAFIPLPQVVMLTDHPNAGGRAIFVEKSPMNLPADFKASWMLVPPGKKVTVFSEADQKGKKRTFDPGVYELSTGEFKEWDDKIASIAVE